MKIKIKEGFLLRKVAGDDEGTGFTGNGRKIRS